MTPVRARPPTLGEWRRLAARTRRARRSSISSSPAGLLAQRENLHDHRWKSAGFLEGRADVAAGGDGRFALDASASSHHPIAGRFAGRSAVARTKTMPLFSSVLNDDRHADDACFAWPEIAEDRRKSSSHAMPAPFSFLRFCPELLKRRAAAADPISSNQATTSSAIHRSAL